jgi:hypothetical protein
MQKGTRAVLALFFARGYLCETLSQSPEFQVPEQGVDGLPIWLPHSEIFAFFRQGHETVNSDQFPTQECILLEPL